MVSVNRIDKCLICEKEYMAPQTEINNKLQTEFNVIYCYKCVRKIKREQELNKRE